MLFDVIGAATIGYAIVSTTEEFMAEKSLMYWGRQSKRNRRRLPTEVRHGVGFDVALHGLLADSCDVEHQG
jgi:hypothetical protein